MLTRSPGLGVLRQSPNWGVLGNRAAPPGLVTAGLVAEYRFTESAGSQVLTDYSGNGNHGQNGSTSGVDTNDATFDGTRATLDGVDNYIVLDTALLGNLTAFSLVAVVSGAAQTDKDIYAEGSTIATGPMCRLTSGAANSAKGRLFLRGDASLADYPTSTNGLETTATVFDGTTHVVGVSVTATQVAFYVDGAGDATESRTQRTRTLNTATIGALRRASTTNFLAGSVYALLKYSRALSAGDHQQIVTYLRAQGVIA